MIKNFLIIICTFGFLLFLTQTTNACFCGYSDIKDTFSSSNYVFNGKVTEIKTSKKAIVGYSMPAVSEILKSRGTGRWEKSIDEVQIVTLEVTEPLKGTTEKTFVLFTAAYNGGGSCGVQFKVGENFVVFASRTQPLLSEEESLQSKESWTLKKRLESDADKFNEQLPLFETDICARTERLSLMKEEIEEIRNFVKNGKWKEKQPLPTRILY